MSLIREMMAKILNQHEDDIPEPIIYIIQNFCRNPCLKCKKPFQIDSVNGYTAKVPDFRLCFPCRMRFQICPYGPTCDAIFPSGEYDCPECLNKQYFWCPNCGVGSSIMEHFGSGYCWRCEDL